MSSSRGWSALVAMSVCLVPAAAGATPADAPPPGTTGSVVAPSARFSWPVNPHVVLRRFDPPEVKWGAGHRGVDLGAAPGSKVVAPADGTVTFTGVVAGRGVLTLRHPEGFDTTYEPITTTLARGDVVKRGQEIGTIASGGHCDTRCLHWGYRVGKDTYRDPLTLVRGIRPVLLPPM